jgi:two-component system sensor histidine kinase/response regulator
MASETPRVLVVDDTPENRKLVHAILEDEDIEVLSAVSGEEALRVFAAEHIDCVLLDVRMPGLDGFETCARLRAMPQGAETPIVFLTALRDVETFDNALRAGGDDFVMKPVTPTELVVRVKAALRLRKMSAELRESFEEVRRQRDALMRLQMQKERLTAFVVHDLKNPVNSLDLHAQLLLRDKDLSSRSRGSVQHIRDEARSLLRLVLNLLDISKSEEGQLAPRRVEVDLEALAADLVESLEVRAAQARVTLARELGVKTLSADADLLRRVLENLLDNAFRHAPEGSTIRLSARAGQDGTEIRIADEGSGISAELRDRVFERFVQLDLGDTVATRTGRGLGLTFCKLAIEAHGGSIWVEEGSPGAIFCMRIPA